MNSGACHLPDPQFTGLKSEKTGLDDLSQGSSWEPGEKPGCRERPGLPVPISTFPFSLFSTLVLRVLRSKAICLKTGDQTISWVSLLFLEERLLLIRLGRRMWNGREEGKRPRSLAARPPTADTDKYTF